MNELSGKTISHYKILECLGSGGMGVVYKAEDTRLKRTVALKFLPGDLTRDAEARKRFVLEAQAAAALNHPNICTIHEIDEVPASLDDSEGISGQSFIAMEYINGQTLHDMIAGADERMPLSFYDAVNYAIQIAEGLQAAHEKGVVHRDIKSANIMVTIKKQAKIMDFGLAKFAGQTKLATASSTRGTIAYMSPEQAHGQKADHRSDIWSLGIVLYQMSTLKLPFDHEYDAAIIYGIIDKSPPPPTKIRDGIPKELERIILKCLRKEPKDRYQSAQQLLSDLKKLNKALAKNPDERYHQVDEMLVDLKSPGRKMESPVTKRPLAKAKLPDGKRKFLDAAILFFFLLIIGSGIYFQWLREKEGAEGIPAVQSAATISSGQWQNSIAVLPFNNISPDPEQEYFCDGMTEQIITNLSRLQTLKVIARTSVMKFKHSEKTIPEIAKELQVAYVLEGSVRKSGNQIRVTAQLIQADNGFYLWANDYDRELEDLFAVQDDVSEAIAGALLTKVTIKEVEELKTKQTKNVNAYEYYLMGKYSHTHEYLMTSRKEDFRKAENMLKKALELDPNYAEAHAGLADLYNTHYNLIYYTASGEEKKKYLRLQQQYIETAYRLASNSAKVNVIKGLVHEAKGERDKEYESYQRAGEINPNDPKYNRAMGSFFRDRGLYHQAIPYYTKAIELDPLYPNSSRGWAYYNIGNFDQAAKEYYKALEIDPDYTLGLRLLAEWFILLKNYDEAEALLARYEKINPDSQRYKLYRAFLYASKGEKEKALAFGKNHLVYLLLNMKEEAIRRLNEEIERRDRSPTLFRDNIHYLNLIHDPFYDSIRDDPRFIKIVAEQKLVYEENLRKYGEVEMN